MWRSSLDGTIRIQNVVSLDATTKRMTCITAAGVMDYYLSSQNSFDLSAERTITDSRNQAESNGADKTDYFRQWADTTPSRKKRESVISGRLCLWTAIWLFGIGSLLIIAVILSNR